MHPKVFNSRILDEDLIFEAEDGNSNTKTET